MKKVSMLDTTFGDGEWAQKSVMIPEQKVQIALKFEEVGVIHVEVGSPASSKFDYQVIKLISKKMARSVIATFSRTLVKDIQLVLDAVEVGINHIIQIGTKINWLYLNNKCVHSPLTEAYLPQFSVNTRVILIYWSCGWYFCLVFC
ncbi:2-isopropylmalate synthase [Xenorhabdus mauleonii]|uniref:2-isopropylmalate synthase n=1 Tax=Xenorhabdus mauleonii TaxID=351675 RepID=A0A1I3I2N6_9GAMM|nr:hypothetical protein [Xenorhabdus mauleonii]PHM40177.1 2-isopropylmalate synthase [Xenorhabdus mauleonii]SFI42109.1 D-citramalate synthase [Xenorhabdus mauleonii]